MANHSCGSSKGTTINMVKILAKQKNGLSMCHINAQSLNNKLDEFRSVFENSTVDIICVSETWLNKFTPDSVIRLNGYKVFRNDRDSHAGGVAIFVKNHIACRFLSKSCRNSSNFNENDENVGTGVSRTNYVEYIFIEILSSGRKLLVGCVYRPNHRINLAQFYKDLEDLSACYTDIVICGDFNCNILSDTSLVDNLLPLGLEATNTAVPTHYTSSTNTLLDLFFVNDLSKVLLYDQISASCFSKHDLIFLTYNFSTSSEDKTYTFRDFKNIDHEELYYNFTLINWNDIYQMPNVDDKLSFLDNNIMSLYDKAVPVRTRTISSKSNPWFNPHIHSLIQQRDLAYSRWKRFKTPELEDLFRAARKEVNCKIKLAKTNYYTKSFGSAVQSGQKWKLIKDIGIGKTNHNVINPSVNVDDLNDAFTNIPSDLTDNSFYDFRSFDQLDQSFEFSCVDQLDVLSCFMSMKSNAIGPDNVNPKFLKILLPVLLPFLTHLLNYIIMTGYFPVKWKHAKILPIPKSSGEFRPIAILCYLSKILEKLLSNQIRDHLNKNGLLCNMQSGFRPDHSCVTALIDVTESIRRELDDNNCNVLVLLDHSKAFDTVHHPTLCMKLRYMFNFSSCSTKLISSYLNNRSQSVYVSNVSSRPLQLSRGVPQGSILGPILFSIYVNDLPQQLCFSKIHMYADDVQVYLSSSLSSINECIDKINIDLSKIQVWAKGNGLYLNPLKSKCLVISKKSVKPVVLNDLLINGQKICIVPTSKNLGIIFNSTLTWSNHINSIVAQAYIKLRSLWATQSFTPLNIRLLLAKSYVIPALLYGCELFASCDSVSKRRLNVVFNNIVRYVYGLKKYTSISTLSKTIYGVCFDSFLKIRVLLFVHKIIYSGKPEYIYDKFRFARSRRGKKLIIPSHQTLTSEWQFYVNATRLWNSLPHSLQLISNVTHFKKQLFSFFENQ